MKTKRKRSVKNRVPSVKEQHEVLAFCPVDAYGRRIVTATLRNVPLLKLAGVRYPRVLMKYAVNVRLVEPGFVVVAGSGSLP